MELSHSPSLFTLQTRYRVSRPTLRGYRRAGSAADRRRVPTAAASERLRDPTKAKRRARRSFLGCKERE
jgi:hypothetical protein